MPTSPSSSPSSSSQAAHVSPLAWHVEESADVGYTEHFSLMRSKRRDESRHSPLASISSSRGSSRSNSRAGSRAGSGEASLGRIGERGSAGSLVAEEEVSSARQDYPVSSSRSADYPVSHAIFGREGGLSADGRAGAGAGSGGELARQLSPRQAGRHHAAQLVAQLAAPQSPTSPNQNQNPNQNPSQNPNQNPSQNPNQNYQGVVAGKGGVGGSGGVAGSGGSPPMPPATSPRSPPRLSSKPRGYQVAPAYAVAAADLLAEGGGAAEAAAAAAAAAGGGGRRNQPTFSFLSDGDESTGGQEGHSFSFSRAFAAHGPSAAAARAEAPSSSPSHLPTSPILHSQPSPSCLIAAVDSSSPPHSPRASSHPLGSPSTASAYSFSRWSGEDTVGVAEGSGLRVTSSGGGRLSEDRAATVPEDGPFHSDPIPPFAPSSSSALLSSPKRSAPRPPSFNEVMKASSGEGFSHDFSDFKQKQEQQKQQQWKQQEEKQQQERRRQQQEQQQRGRGQGHAGAGVSGGDNLAIMPVSRAPHGPVGEMLARAVAVAQGAAGVAPPTAAGSAAVSSSAPPPPAFHITQVAHASPLNTGPHHQMLPAKPVPPMSAHGGAAGGDATDDVDEIIKQVNKGSMQRPPPPQQQRRQGLFFCC
ncbi:hypothetical protein CLOM_g967 [Closterium sp. NIES-68]|nr:hypothetical protein CLOM_g967 [Closterium sp. NIES-68]